MSEELQLEHLVGQHILDAVDFAHESKPIYPGSEHTEIVEVIRFRLDGIVYEAAEDADDGYRSAMNYINVVEAPVQNIFPPVAVLARMQTEERYSGEDHILELLDAATGLVILSVGTGDYDDYYPYWIAKFDPTAMVTNQQQEPTP